MGLCPSTKAARSTQAIATDFSPSTKRLFPFSNISRASDPVMMLLFGLFTLIKHSGLFKQQERFLVKGSIGKKQ